MAAPMTAAIPWALQLGEGYTLRFTAVSQATGATVAGVTVSGVTVEGQTETSEIGTTSDNTPLPLLVPLDNAA